MKKIKQCLHYVSYLQYPLQIISLWFYVPFIISLNAGNTDWIKLNYSLIFFGISVSLASLQDSKKISLKFEKFIWTNKKLGRVFIYIIIFLAFSLILYGVFGYFFSSNKSFKEISFGITALGIGFVGLLKTSIEVFENQSHHYKQPDNINSD